MFLNITEDDIRMNCPEAAPMTLRAFNKLNPRQFNSKVSVLYPYEIPRYAPTSSTQFAKSLLQQTPAASSPNIIVSDVQVTELAKQLTNTATAQNFVSNVGDEDPGVSGLVTATLPDLVDEAAGDAYDAGAEVMVDLIGKTVDIIKKEIAKKPALNEDRERMMGDFRGGESPVSVAIVEDLEDIKKPEEQDPFSNEEREELMNLM